jgi:hypothetical protein
MMLGEWYFMERRDIKPQDKDYLIRWIVLQCPWFSVYVHKFLSSDDERALHDHPWNFFSIILKGAYKEHCWMNKYGNPTVCNIRKMGSIGYREANWKHRVELITPTVWTLMLVSPRKRAKWGFWPKANWCWWRTYNQKNGLCENEILYHYGKD